MIKHYRFTHSSTVRAFAALAILSSGNMASAQSVFDRAATMSDDARTGVEFNQQAIDDAVTPYTTALPPEAGFQESTFEDRIEDLRDGTTTQGRILQATEDSYVVRPDVTIAPDSPLMDDANWADANAEDVAGQYFTANDGGTCTTPDLPVSDLVDQFCRSVPATQMRTCDLIRRIWVDRWDYYKCDERSANFVRICNKTTTYSCRVNSTQNSCLHNNIRFLGVDSVTWAGSLATLHFDAPPPRHDIPVLVIGPQPTNHDGHAHVVDHDFAIRISDQFKVDGVFVKHVASKGVSQLESRGTSMGIFVADRFTATGSTALSPCTGPLTTGFITPSTLFIPPAFYNGIVLLYSAEWQAPEVYWNIYTHQDPGYLCTLAYMNGNETVTLNTSRPVDVLTYANANPETPARFKSTPVTFRVVYREGDSQAGSGELKIDFEGSCCDSFTAVETEQCS